MTCPAQQDAVSTVERAFAVLGAFRPGGRALSIRDISRACGIPRSSVHRHVAELERCGALERVDGGLRIGMRMFELGAMALGDASLHEIAASHAHDLHEISGLTVNVGVRAGMHVVYIEKIGSRRDPIVHTRLGGRGRLHATALGKAILATSDPADLEPVLTRTLERLTAHTIVDPPALRRELARVRRAGVAFDREESRDGLFCVAAAVLDRRGAPIASVSAAGATSFAAVDRYAPAVVATAHAIGRSLSGTS